MKIVSARPPEEPNLREGEGTRRPEGKGEVCRDKSGEERRKSDNSDSAVVAAMAAVSIRCGVAASDRLEGDSRKFLPEIGKNSGRCLGGTSPAAAAVSRPLINS